MIRAVKVRAVSDASGNGPVFTGAAQCAASHVKHPHSGRPTRSAGMLDSVLGSRRTGQGGLFAGEGRGEFRAGDRAGEHRVVVGDRVVVLGL